MVNLFTFNPSYSDHQEESLSQKAFLATIFAKKIRAALMLDRQSLPCVNAKI